MTKELTGYPSIDKPWLKYFSEEALREPLPKCSLYDMLHKGNAEHLSDVALNYYGCKTSYRTLFEQIEKTAKAFSTIGIKQGDVVIFCTVNMPETVYSFYALNRLGAVINLVDPRTSEEGLREYINECNATALITVDLAYPIIKKAVQNTDVRKIIVVSPADSLSPIKRFFYLKSNPRKVLEANAIRWDNFIANGVDATPQYVPYEKGRCAIIAHTGGTTGIPKGVMLSDDNLNSVTHGYKYCGIPFNRQDRYFNDLPPFIVYGLSLAMHTTLCYGLQVILYPVFDSKEFPKQFAKYKPHHFSALTDHLKYLMEDKRTRHMNLSFLTTAAVGGDSLNTETERRFNSYLERGGTAYQTCKGYGMTELAATAISTSPLANKIGSVGIPLITNGVKIVDLDSGKEMKINETGEIWVSSPSLMLGYYKNKAETDKIIVTDEDGTRYIKTGDIGHVDEDGLLFHEGRIRRIYITSFDGQPAKIFPGLIEDVIKKCERVYDCVVVGRLVGDSACYEAVAYIVVDNEKQADNPTIIANIKGACEKNLPTYMVPVEYRFVTEFPHTPIGKVDFRKLEEECVKEQ